jgi:hypothetical protein
MVNTALAYVGLTDTVWVTNTRSGSSTTNQGVIDVRISVTVNSLTHISKKPNATEYTQSLKELSVELNHWFDFDLKNAGGGVTSMLNFPILAASSTNFTNGPLQSLRGPMKFSRWA